MEPIDVFDGAYKARAKFNGIDRKGVIVKLTAESSEGIIRYEVSTVFFPYRDPEDFGISYDAVFTQEIYKAKGRRSKKKEEGYIAKLPETVAELLKDKDAEVFWEEPIRPVRRA